MDRPTVTPAATLRAVEVPLWNLLALAHDCSPSLTEQIGRCVGMIECCLEQESKRLAELRAIRPQLQLVVDNTVQP